MRGDMYVMTVDCSTTASKAIVWDLTGCEVASARRSYPLVRVGSKGYEQDAELWWSATVAALSEAVSKVDAARVGALCVTHQRETVVVTDEEGTPRGPAVVWMDHRCDGVVEELAQRYGRGELARRTGKEPCVTPSWYKLVEWKRRAPDVFADGARVLDVGGFLVWRLTGQRSTAEASADPTGMVWMEERAWDERLVGALCSMEGVSKLVGVGERMGEVSDEVARVTGLPRGLPVIAGGGDGQAACLGAGVLGGARAYLNLGTAVVSGVCRREYAVSRAFRTLYGLVPETYMFETDLKGGTFTLEWWVRSVLGWGDRSDAYAVLEREAEAVGVGSGGVLAVPYWAGVMNPYWDDDARGAFVGLQGRHGRGHLWRALLEGVALEQRLHTEGVEEAMGERIGEFVVMGGGSESALWCQIVADVTGKRVVRCASREATSLGAAVVAACGVGCFASFEEATGAMCRDGVAWTPRLEAQRRYDELYEIYRGVFPALRSGMSALARWDEEGAQ